MTSKLKVNLINDSGDNNLITSDGSGSVTLGTAFPSVGKIGQVLSTTKTDSFNTTSTSYVDLTGITLNITPSATTSKILISLSLSCQLSQANNQVYYLKLVRGSTAIGGSSSDDAFRMSYSASIYVPQQVDFQFLDTPSSISQQTYKVQIKTSGDTFYLNRNASGTTSCSSFTVMEVLA
jgi:hypothetical protein